MIDGGTGDAFTGNTLNKNRGYAMFSAMARRRESKTAGRCGRRGDIPCCHTLGLYRRYRPIEDPAGEAKKEKWPPAQGRGAADFPVNSDNPR